MSFFDNIKKAASNLVKTEEKREVVFDDIPTTLEAFKALVEKEHKDPFGMAALTIVALNIYPVNKDLSIEMDGILTCFLNGRKRNATI